jgi:hypothetical protein
LRLAVTWLLVVIATNVDGVFGQNAVAFLVSQAFKACGSWQSPVPVSVSGFDFSKEDRS